MSTRKINLSFYGKLNVNDKRLNYKYIFTYVLSRSSFIMTQIKPTCDLFILIIEIETIFIEYEHSMM